MRTSREMFDLVINAQNNALLDGIIGMITAAEKLSGKLMPVPMPKNHNRSGMSQITDALRELREARLQFKNIKARIEEVVNDG